MIIRGRFLAFVKLSHNAVRRPNFHQLYEEFLSAYDRDTRIDFGAWYTPVVLADFIARLVFFNIRVNPDLKILQNNPFFVIDPCCGTGTFLESVLTILRCLLNQNSSALRFFPYHMPWPIIDCQSMRSRRLLPCLCI